MSVLNVLSVLSVLSVVAGVFSFFGSFTTERWRGKEEKKGMRGKADLRDRSPLFIPLAEARHVTC